MAKVQQYDAGEYTLVVDRYQRADGTDFEKGDPIQLDAADATRLFNSGAVDYSDSFTAKKARGEIQGDRVDLNADVTTLRAQLESLQAAIADKERVLEAKGGPQPILDSNLNTNDRVANAASVSPEAEIERLKAETQPEDAVLASDLDGGQLVHERLIGGAGASQSEFASGTAEQLATEEGLSASDIQTRSGSGGKITADDVRAHVASQQQS